MRRGSNPRVLSLFHRLPQFQRERSSFSSLCIRGYVLSAVVRGDFTVPAYNIMGRYYIEWLGRYT